MSTSFKMEDMDGETIATVQGTLEDENGITIDPTTTTIIFEPVEPESIILDTSERYRPETSKGSNRKTRRYSEELFLKFGFIPSPTNLDLPLCLICERVFSNESMKTPRLREHLTKIHPDKAEFDVAYFKALKEQFYVTRKIGVNDVYQTQSFRKKILPKERRSGNTMLSYAPILNKSKLQDLAGQWLEEDCPGFDVQSIIVGRTHVRGHIKCKDSAILAGFPFVEAVLTKLGSKIPAWNYQEGFYLHAPADENAKIVGVIIAPADEILMAERVILNILARCSGVATAMYNARTTLSWNGWQGQVVGSRKTTPGFRLVEKYGLLVGGGGTHRMDMSQMVMLKDNHLHVTGRARLPETIQRARKVAGFHMKVEIECSTMEEGLNAAAAGADIVMLDNFQPEDAIEAAKTIKLQYPNVLIEASGGITHENCTKYAIQQIDIISMSCLVQGYPTIDFSLDLD